MKKIIMAMTSIMSMVCMTNIFSSEKDQLLGKQVQKGVFELTGKDLVGSWSFSVKNGNEVVIEKAQVDDKDAQKKVYINLLLPTQLILYKYIPDDSSTDTDKFGGTFYKWDKVGTYTFPTGKDIRVVLKKFGSLIPQTSFKGLLSKNKNVTQGDISYEKNPEATPEQVKIVKYGSDEWGNW